MLFIIYLQNIINNSPHQLISIYLNHTFHTIMLLIDKYKPLKFTDYHKDTAIIPILKLVISESKSDTNNDNYSYSYPRNILLYGDDYSGKTTLLHSFVLEYYNDVPASLISKNILYINNINDQGINFYRNDVKHFCQITSNIPKKKKIIVLDDFDTINEHCQQVFRSFMDTYSNNVIFLGSATNINKIIDSIQSRFNILSLLPISTKIINHTIEKIKVNEKISLDSDAENFVISISNNNLKLILQYFQKFKLYNKHINLTLAKELCGAINFIFFEKYINLILDNNLKDAIAQILKLYETGYSVIDILDLFFFFIKKTDLIDDPNIKYNIIKYICKYMSIFYNTHEDSIELVFFTNNLVSIIHNIP